MELSRPEVTTADLRRAAWTSSLGSALEYYDFALYSLAAALVFGPLFFPHQGTSIGLIASFATYFLGFAVRPIGGILFGMVGDRFGRKLVLLLTVTLMGGASTAIGLVPTYQTIGIWAPILLIVLRLLQGLGAGAEQAGAAVLMTEYAPKGRRGFYAALPFLGIQIGTVIAAIVYFALLFHVTNVLQSWLWRLPFLLSSVILIIALYMRFNLKESPAFAEIEEEEHARAMSLPEVVRESWKTILLGMGLRMAENGGSSIYQVLAVSYSVNVVGMRNATGALSLLCAAIVGAFVVPAAGLLSDRFGRIPVYRGFAILQMLAALPVWYALSFGYLPLTIAALSLALGCATWGMFGTQGALLPEMFGSRHRYLGVSLTREVSAVLSGGIAPLVGSVIIAVVTSHDAGAARPGLIAWVPLALYVMVLAAITIVTTLFAPEPRDRDLLDRRDLINS
ncbi:MFS transporter [Gluconacetobacter diazotrophicus]|uniref:MFS transporter n=2 Tax=Gluconacetobacter diazotrophicus TaxID=33996 RepID=A0A7W4I3Z0_GLUDI|nr:MFS transporter [Gluconacetobacter diazotrophicus]